MTNNLVKIVLASLLSASFGCTSSNSIKHVDKYAPCRQGLNFVRKLADADEKRKSKTGESSGFVLNFDYWDKPPSNEEMDCIGEGLQSETNYRIIYDVNSGKYIVMPKDYKHKSAGNIKL